MLIFFLTAWLAKGKDLTCHLSVCPDIRKGNHICELGCMTSYCNFDTLITTDGKINKESSDCYEYCINIDGCDPEILGNGVCDSPCNTENCGFDLGDCTCAPECLDSMLGDGNCDEACDNWDCDLDNHDCGHCADGCFPNMLGNGVCDPECNNEDCLYDYNDCQCAEGCLLIDYGTCKPECLVASCSYDRLTQYPNSWCQNTSLSIFSSYQQIARNDFLYITNLEDCYEASNAQCTFEKSLDFVNCYDECNILECNYANGNCPFVDSIVCNRTYNSSYDALCLSCGKAEDSLTFALVNGRCQSWPLITVTPSTFPDSTKVVVPFIDTSSAKIPHVYFVCPDSNPDAEDGEGTYFSPFTSLEYSYNNIMYSHSVVYLLECDQYYLTTLDLRQGRIFITNEAAYVGKHVKFIPWNINSKIIIKRGKEKNSRNDNSAFEFVFINAENIEISNLIFDWKFHNSDCNDEIYCDYCPLVTYNDELNLHYNDRGEIINDFIPSYQCEWDGTKYFSTIQSSNLLLKNVSFINFRNGFNAILLVKDDSNVTLKNVTFDNIKVSDSSESWVVSWEGTGYGNLMFENGVVSRLNNGYELIDPINTKGFLNATGINSIVFRNVEFLNNAVIWQSLTSFKLASLIFLNIFQYFWVDSCSFLYNYCDYGIINIQQELNSFSMEIDDSSIISYSRLNHVHISNSKFISNYGKTAGVLYALYNAENQNIFIENSSFSLNGIESSSLIYIESNYVDKNDSIDRKVNETLSDGDTIEVNYLAKWAKFYNLNFTENYSGKNGIIELIKMVNIEWKNILISSNGLLSSEIMNANSLLLKYYIEDPSMYVKLYINSPADLNCQSLSAISDSINFNIEEINAYNNFCKYSSPNIIISNTTNSKIKSASFYDNKGSGSYGTCLALLEDANLEILDAEFYSNTNQFSGSGTISSLSSLLMQNCTFSNNIGNLHVEGQSLSIFSSHFDSNSSPQSNGGAISLSISTDALYSYVFSIINTTFVNNYCSSSGGAIYIEKKTPLNLPLAFKIENANFYNNQAVDGSCIYIDNSVAFTQNSSIINSSFQENKASSSGTIFASYLYGILAIENCIFIKNAGVYSSVLNIAIGENDEENPSKTILNYCTFQFNSGNITVSLDNISINSTLEGNLCLFEYNIGVTFSLDNDYAILKRSKIQHNFSPNFGGALNLKNSAIFISEDINYLNCSSDTNAGVAWISLRSQFICFSCVFIDNYAALSGGVIYADSDAAFNITDSIFSKNSCKNKGSAVFMASSLVSSSIYNSEIYDNYAYEGTIFILSSLISIFSSKIHNNTSDGKNPGFFLDDSSGIIENTTFSAQIGNEGCFIYMSASFVNISNSMIYKGFSTSSGVAIHATSSNVQIYSSTFFELFSNDTGGAIYVYEESTISIKDSQFLNSESSIDSYSSSIFIENTLFKNHTYTAIYASQIERLKISRSEFVNGYGTNGGALYCAQCNIILIESSSFINNLADYGGAIYVANQADHNQTSKIAIVSSNFQLNAALNGGAIWTDNINFEISTSIFIENKAESLKTDLKEIVDGIGGALKIGCQNYICIFKVSSSYFIRNRATYNGGAINWDDSKPIFENNIFKNNSAQYGPDIASFPIIMIYLSNITRNLESKTFSDDKSNLILNNVASGQKNNPSLVFALVDDLYQTIATDSASQAQMQAMDADTIISGTTVVYAKNGIYYFNDYIISANPGSSAFINIVSSAIDTNKIITSSESMQMSSSFSVNVNLRLCEIGEATVGLHCESCPEFYYNIDPKKSKCLECPSSAICYGNFTIVPKSGYWRDNELTDKFWKCAYPPACLGSPNISNLSLTGFCKKGYENNMCHSCSSGYSRLYKTECEACPDLISNVFRWIGISAFLILISIIILKIARNSWYKPNSLFIVYLKICWNYLQIMIIIATYNLKWPYEVTQFFYIQTSLDYIGGQLFSFDCFLQLTYPKSKIYYIKIFITSLTPFFVAFLCLGIWILIYKIKRKQISEMKDDYISTCIVLLFLIHPSIIDIMFSAFSCKEINSGEFWLNADLGIRCWDHYHLFYAFLLALPTIIVWVVLLPLICLIHLIKHKHHLGEIWLKKRYSFLYNGYNSKHYYWEFIILYCKVILIACSVFLSNITVNSQALTAALILVIFLYYHTRNEPFSKDFMNKAETFSRLVSLTTILFGLCFLTNDIGATVSYLLAALLIAANLLFIAYILINILLQFAIIFLINLIAF